PRLFVAWGIGCLIGLILRASLLGRPIPDGIEPTFAIVAFSVILVFLLIWRGGYIFLATRNATPQKKNS
ncbi:MAG: DUF3054 family protein, partial [Chloroflexota bacterium]